MDVAIEAEGLCKRYGEVEALRQVDVLVPSGSVLGLLGPNGAGKTTAVRVLATLLDADSGRARVAGFDVAKQPDQVRRRIGLTGQYAAVDEQLTGRENLILIGRLYRLGRRDAKQRAVKMLDQFELAGAGDRQVKTYSGGMRRRLDLAASLIADPEVIFLDEPSTGLDPASRLGLWRMVRDQVASGVTVLLTTQYLEEADQLADQIAVIDSGQVIANGTPDDLKRKVGLEHLEVGLASPDELPALLRALSEVAGGEPAVGENGRSVSVPLIDGMEAIAAVATVLHAEGIAVQDFALRRPSLDDVFLTLTGRSAATAVPDTPNSGGSKEGTAAS